MTLATQWLDQQWSREGPNIWSGPAWTQPRCCTGCLGPTDSLCPLDYFFAIWGSIGRLKWSDLADRWDPWILSCVVSWEAGTPSRSSEEHVRMKRLSKRAAGTFHRQRWSLVFARSPTFDQQPIRCLWLVYCRNLSHCWLTYRGEGDLRAWSRVHLSLSVLHSSVWLPHGVTTSAGLRRASSGCAGSSECPWSQGLARSQDFGTSHRSEDCCFSPLALRYFPQSPVMWTSCLTRFSE